MATLSTTLATSVVRHFETLPDFTRHLSIAKNNPKTKPLSTKTTITPIKLSNIENLEKQETQNHPTMQRLTRIFLLVCRMI